MVLVKVLKRKDASSVLVAILLALIISQPLSTTTSRPAGKITGSSNGAYSYGGPGTGWKDMYLFPVVWALLQIIVLEILGWVYVWSTSSMKKK